MSFFIFISLFGYYKEKTSIHLKGYNYKFCTRIAEIKQIQPLFPNLHEN